MTLNPPHDHAEDDGTDQPLPDLHVVHDVTIHPDQLVFDPFLDDTPLTCGVENPDACESCQ